MPLTCPAIMPLRSCVHRTIVCRHCDFAKCATSAQATDAQPTDRHHVKVPGTTRCSATTRRAQQPWHVFPTHLTKPQMAPIGPSDSARFNNNILNIISYFLYNIYIIWISFLYKLKIINKNFKTILRQLLPHLARILLDIHTVYIYIYILIYILKNIGINNIIKKDDRKKFRSQTSDNMDKSKAEVEQKNREEKSRREKIRKRKSQKNEGCRCAKR